MTNSHDTSTPSMSAKTVPSDWNRADRLLYTLAEQGYHRGKPVLVNALMVNVTFDQRHATAEQADAVTDRIFQALSASRLAKEGGEAGAVERLKDAVEGETDGVALTDAQAAAILAYVGLPQPSPALAKGGDAVRLLSCPFCGGAPTLHPHSPDHMLGAWVSCSTCGLESPTETGRSVEAAVQHWNTRAALSTPTEGPASAEDWLRGMARMSSYPVEICQKFEDLADLIMERHNATA